MITELTPEQEILLKNYQNRLHAEGETAIEFADGFGAYFERGKVLSLVFPEGN